MVKKQVDEPNLTLEAYASDTWLRIKSVAGEHSLIGLSRFLNQEHGYVEKKDVGP